MRVALTMVLALAMILFGAELFTNAVEWLGRKLHLGDGAVGSVLAALGTALPETAVPVTAIAFGGGSNAATDVGVGGILGAPFLLATLGSLIMAISLVWLRRHEPKPVHLAISPRAFHRDMSFFLLAYALTMLVGCLPVPWVHHYAPMVLVGLYVLFVVVTLRDRDKTGADEQLHPLYIQWKSTDPALGVVLTQLALALGLIVGGAHLLATGVEHIATTLQIPAFVLSALLIPLATELPETFNSVVWIRQGKDALALGNITGAMVFQSTLVPALGISLTPWMLNQDALLTGGLTLAAGGLIFGLFRLRGALVPGVLFAASLLYWVLPLKTIAFRYELEEVWWVGGGLLVILLYLALKMGMSVRNA